MNNKQFAIICNPENRRFDFFRQAVLSVNNQEPIVISYLDLLQNKVDLDTLFSQIDVLKIETFGENFEVKKELIALGTSEFEPNFISKEEALNLPFDKGRIEHSKQLYLGFCNLLDNLQQHLDKFPNIQVMNSPKSIKTMFNKTKTHQFLNKNNLAVIPAMYEVKNFEDLLLKMKTNNWSRVFIKPNYTSSASGVIAFRVNKDKMQAITSVFIKTEKEEVKLYNSLKIQTYTDYQTIKTIVNLLAKDSFIVEKWMTKVSNAKGVYDFRIHTVNAKVKQVVARQSKSPMTNLHLGNERGDLKEIKKDIGSKNWQNLCELAEKTATKFDQSLYIGLDVLLTKNQEKPYIIEANAFGDLLPNVLIDGKNTYETQVNYYLNIP